MANDAPAPTSPPPSTSRVWPTYLRLVCAMILAMSFHAVYAGWHWHVELRTGKGLRSLSPTSSIWREESARTLLGRHTQEWVIQRGAAYTAFRTAWQSRLFHAVPTILPVALVAVLSYALLTRRYGPSDLRDPYCRCRKCRQILMGLQAPRCPECGEAI